MSKPSKCDRCQKQFYPDDFWIDVSHSEYSCLVCETCAIQIEIMMSVTKQSALTGESPKQILKEMLALYE